MTAQTLKESLLEHALRLLDLGFSVIPMIPGTKKAYVKWKPFQDKLPSRQTVRRWFKKWPNANIAIITGKLSGIFVLDFDGPKARPMLEKELGIKLDETVSVITGSGGLHLYYIRDSNINKNYVRIVGEKGGDGVDIRSDGGLALAPPSINKNGNSYEWGIKPKADLSNIAECPPELIELLTSDAEQESEQADKVTIGERNDFRTKKVGSFLARNPKATREETIVYSIGVNVAHCSPPSPVEEAIQTAKHLFKKDRKTKVLEMPEGITGKELMKQTYPEPKWAIPEIMTEGLYLLVAKPKNGKSFMALNMSIAIEKGYKIFGLPVKQGSVTYLALEDTPRRLQGRAEKMLLECPSDLSGLHLYTSWPTMNEGGLELLREKIQKTPNTRLVIIDTLQMFRGISKTSGYSYAEDYNSIASIKKLTDDLGVSILMIHHLRKSESNDIFDSVSGTLGINGAVDGVLILENGNQKDITRLFTLHITGRDVESKKMQVKFDPETLWWRSIKDQPRVISEKQCSVLESVKRVRKGVSAKEVAELTGVKEETASKTLRRLEEKGVLKKLYRGKYKYVEPVDQVSLPEEEDNE